MLSFGLIGIEEAAKIIQNPFGDDDSDLVRFRKIIFFAILNPSVIQCFTLQISNQSARLCVSLNYLFRYHPISFDFIAAA
jgi:hypothetical protein